MPALWTVAPQPPSHAAGAQGALNSATWPVRAALTLTHLAGGGSGGGGSSSLVAHGEDTGAAEAGATQLAAALQLAPAGTAISAGAASQAGRGSVHHAAAAVLAATLRTGTPVPRSLGDMIVRDGGRRTMQDGRSLLPASCSLGASVAFRLQLSELDAVRLALLKASCMSITPCMQ
jgi:hypothetical protein